MVGSFVATRERVFTSAVPQIYFDHAATPPVAPSTVVDQDIPAPLEELVLALLAKDPKQRPKSARALRATLAELSTSYPWTQEQARTWWSEEGDGSTLELGVSATQSTV